MFKSHDQSSIIAGGPVERPVVHARVNEDHFQTSDLSFVAAALCFGAKIETVERNNGPRATFYLRREKGLDGLVDGFYNHSMQLDPLLYFNALKEAKTHLYSAAIY